MSKFITCVVYNGTKQNYAIPGGSVDRVMLKIRKMKHLRNASAFLFINRNTGSVVDARCN